MEVRKANDVLHVSEKLHESVEVAVAKVSHSLVVSSEDIDSLVDRAVLNRVFPALLHFHEVAETFFQEEDLHRKRPTLNVLVVVIEVRIERYLLVHRLPMIVLSEHFG